MTRADSEKVKEGRSLKEIYGPDAIKCENEGCGAIHFGQHECDWDGPCPCGHRMGMCHRAAAARWCPPDPRLDEAVAERDKYREALEGIRDELPMGALTPILRAQAIAHAALSNPQEEQ